MKVRRRKQKSWGRQRPMQNISLQSVSVALGSSVHFIVDQPNLIVCLLWHLPGLWFSRRTLQCRELWLGDELWRCPWEERPRLTCVLLSCSQDWEAPS